MSRSLDGPFSRCSKSHTSYAMYSRSGDTEDARAVVGVDRIGHGGTGFDHRVQPTVLRGQLVRVSAGPPLILIIAHGAPSMLGRDGRTQRPLPSRRVGAAWRMPGL